MPAPLDPAIKEKVVDFWAAEAHPAGGNNLSCRKLYQLYKQKVVNNDVGWAKFAQIVAGAIHGDTEPFDWSEWKPWEKSGESAGDRAFLLTMDAVCQAVQSRHLHVHEAVWAMKLIGVLQGLKAYDQFCFVSLYGLRELVAHYSRVDLRTGDLDAILAYRPWLPENAHAYATATAASLAPRPRMGSRAEYPSPPDRIEELSIQASVENFSTGKAWETLRVDLRLPWHYRTRLDLSKSSPEPFANFGLYPNQDKALEFWMGDNPVFEPPAEHGMYGLTELMSLDDEITGEITGREEAPK